MPNARDIMNKSPLPQCPNATALAKTCAFRETFGMSLPIVRTVWRMLGEEDLLPEGSYPNYLRWALHFLKVYPLHAPGCAAVSVSSRTMDPKIHHKRVWAFIKAVAALENVIVSLLTM
jgi:hypothetical protein